MSTSVIKLFIVCCAISCYHGQTIPENIQLILQECGKFPYSTFKNTNISGHTAFALSNYPNTCIDCKDCESGTTPLTWNCLKNSNSQWWNLKPIPNNNISSISAPKSVLFQSVKNGSTCIEVIGEYYTTMSICNSSNINQQFIINSNEYISSQSNTSLCLTMSYFNCTMTQFNKYPYCNQELPADQRVNDLVSRMNLYEKTQNLAIRTNPGVIRLGVPPNLFAEALHGVRCNCGDTYNNNTGCPTSFPHALLLGATFNRSLWKIIGEAISTEARAFANTGNGRTEQALFRHTPDINLFRDPRWGRGQEVPGEDPFLTGQYVMEFSYNMQFGEDTKYLKLVTVCKHYADYDQEGNFGIGRTSFDANVTMQDQVEYYWPAWRTAIQTGKIQSIMCSYNAVNNIPSCGNDYFINQIARDEWGFDGFVESDCSAIGDQAFTRYIQQQYPKNNETFQKYQQANQALSSGCDTNCGNFYLEHLQDSVENGITSEEDVTLSVKRLFMKTVQLGKLDFNPPPYYRDINAYGLAQIDSPEHRALALNAAEQGIVLLKNENNILPLSTQNANGKTIALIGPHANATIDMLSNYIGGNKLVYSNSPYDAFTAYGEYDIVYKQGCDWACNTTTGFQDAVSAAKDADYSIVFLGLHPDNCKGHSNEGSACESEGHDRNTINLPSNQTSLLQQVYAVNKNTILVLINAGPVNISWAKDNIPGIIEAWYPGELGGVAIRNIIYGDSAVAGKLPVTIYDESLMKSRASIMDMSLRDNGGITYRYYQGTPLYSFGYGLYYTNFSYKYYNSSDLDIGGERVIDTKILADFYRNGYYFYKSDSNSFVVQVTNIGNRGSDCVVLGFVTAENDPDAPLIKLFDFERVYVDIGKSVNVTLSVTPESISITNKNGNERIVPGKYNLFVGDYQNNNYVHIPLRMKGKAESIFNLLNLI